MTSAWPRHVEDVLALAGLTGRGSVQALDLWACDCVRRAVVETLPQAIAAELRTSLLMVCIKDYVRGHPVDGNMLQMLSTAITTRLEQREQRAPELGSLLNALTTLTLGDGSSEVTAAQVARLAGEAMLPHQGELAPLREIEARWQARRLLWRTGLMPGLPDMLVRLDQAEAAGALPKPGPALRRFDALRARIHAEDDARLDLILEFTEVIYLRELDQLAG